MVWMRWPWLSPAKRMREHKSSAHQLAQFTTIIFTNLMWESECIAPFNVTSYDLTRRYGWQTVFWK